MCNEGGVGGSMVPCASLEQGGGVPVRATAAEPTAAPPALATVLAMGVVLMVRSRKSVTRNHDDFLVRQQEMSDAKATS